MLVFIGTLHSGFTPTDELVQIIEDIKPSCVLVEVLQSDIDNDHLQGYADEMLAVLNWAVEHNTKVCGFDSDIQVVREDASDQDIKNLDDEQKNIIQRHDWKIFNQPGFEDILKTKSWNKVIDADKENKREQQMYRNIMQMADKSRITVVITGSGHVPFFKDKFPEARFPLSSK